MRRFVPVVDPTSRHVVWDEVAAEPAMVGDHWLAFGTADEAAAAAAFLEMTARSSVGCDMAIHARRGAPDVHNR